METHKTHQNVTLEKRPEHGFFHSISTQKALKCLEQGIYRSYMPKIPNFQRGIQWSPSPPHPDSRHFSEPKITSTFRQCTEEMSILQDLVKFRDGQKLKNTEKHRKNELKTRKTTKKAKILATFRQFSNKNPKS